MELRREVDRRASLRKRTKGALATSLAVVAVATFFLVRSPNSSEVTVGALSEPTSSVTTNSGQPEVSVAEDRLGNSAASSTTEVIATTTTEVIAPLTDEFTGRWRLGALADDDGWTVFEIDPGVSISIEAGLGTVVSENCSFVFEISGPMPMTSLTDSVDGSCDSESPAGRLRMKLENRAISATTTFVQGGDPEVVLLVWDESGNQAGFTR